MENFLETLLENFSEDQDVAGSWLVTVIVVSILSTGLVMGWKFFRKLTATTIDHKIWSRGSTWLLIFVGLFPTFFILSGVWYLTRDFYNFVNPSNLMLGTATTWLFYVVLMIIGHLVSPWRRELI